MAKTGLDSLDVIGHLLVLFELYLPQGVVFLGVFFQGDDSFFNSALPKGTVGLCGDER